MPSINLNHFLSTALATLLLTASASLEAESFQLRDYPMSDHLVMGSVPASLQARQMHTFYAPTNGPIELLVPSMSGQAAKGELLAFQNRKRIELEGRLLTLERQLTEKQEIPEQQIALFQTLRQIRNREAEISQQLEFIEKIGTSPELIQLFGPTDGKDRLKEENMTNQLKSERLATQQLLNHLNDPAIRVLAQELTNLKLRMRELEHEKQLAEARIEMPFDGYYQVLLPVETGRTEVKVLQGAALLRVEDLKEIHATVEIYGVRWRQFPRERLTLRIPGMHGLDESDQAPFNKIVAVGIDPLSGALRYSFAFRGEAAERAAILRGGTVTAEILLKLGDQPARIVPKLDLLEAYPEAFRDSWEAGASQVFENLEAIYVGREALALLFTPE
jgi:hypothetical protein